MIVGLRPEDFEDASLVGERNRGLTFKTNIDVLESMGSEYYAYFVVESERVSSSELEELAADAGAGDLSQGHGGTQIVARLDADSKVKQGQDQELWFDTSHLHLFDPESGRSLLSAEHGGRLGRAAWPVRAARRHGHQAAPEAGRCPSRARPACPASTRSTTSCAPAAGRRWPAWPPGCAG